MFWNNPWWSMWTVDLKGTPQCCPWTCFCGPPGMQKHVTLHLASHFPSLLQAVRPSFESPSYRRLPNRNPSLFPFFYTTPYPSHFVHLSMLNPRNTLKQPSRNLIYQPFRTWARFFLHHRLVPPWRLMGPTNPPFLLPAVPLLGLVFSYHHPVPPQSQMGPTIPSFWDA